MPIELIFTVMKKEWKCFEVYPKEHILILVKNRTLTEQWLHLYHHHYKLFHPLSLKEKELIPKVITYAIQMGTLTAQVKWSAFIRYFSSKKPLKLFCTCSNTSHCEHFGVQCLVQGHIHIMRGEAKLELGTPLRQQSWGHNWWLSNARWCLAMRAADFQMLSKLYS